MREEEDLDSDRLPTTPMLGDQTFLAPIHVTKAPMGPEPEGGNTILQRLPSQESNSLVFFFKPSLPPGKRKALPIIIVRYVLINDAHHRFCRKLSNF